MSARQGLTLYLLRHAKSAWDDPTLDDFDRTLNKRGLREADWAATLIAERDIRPQRILCSPAQRTRQTLGPLIDRLGDGPPVQFERRIYAASADGLLAVLHEQSPEDAAILIIGHNPGLEDLSRRLAGRSDRDAAARLVAGFPTAGLATIGFDVPAWTGLAAGGGHLKAFDAPSR